MRKGDPLPKANWIWGLLALHSPPPPLVPGGLPNVAVWPIGKRSDGRLAPLAGFSLLCPQLSPAASSERRMTMSVPYPACGNVVRCQHQALRRSRRPSLPPDPTYFLRAVATLSILDVPHALATSYLARSRLDSRRADTRDRQAGCSEGIGASFSFRRSGTPVACVAQRSSSRARCASRTLPVRPPYSGQHGRLSSPASIRAGA